MPYLSTSLKNGQLLMNYNYLTCIHNFQKKGKRKSAEKYSSTVYINWSCHEWHTESLLRLGGWIRTSVLTILKDVPIKIELIYALRQ